MCKVLSDRLAEEKKYLKLFHANILFKRIIKAKMAKLMQ
jgi:hypothetical protein